MNETPTQRKASEKPVVINLQGVSKCFILRMQKPFLLHDALGKILGRGRGGQEFWALRDVDIQIRQGESVAVIGGNGAGKSTLLGLVAGTIHPTSGDIHVKGRIGALLELGAGFHADLTGRENIYLNASLLGLKREEVEEQFPKILDFSELHEFIDVTLKSYSSGMNVRLGFSVAVHVHPEILLMDEVLAVGDQNFQHKCVSRILEFKREGKTLLFVSHTPAAVRALCERVIWLEHGRVQMDGPTNEVLDAYIATAQ